MSTSELIKFDGEILTFNHGKITSVTLTEEGGYSQRYRQSGNLWIDLPNLQPYT